MQTIIRKSRDFEITGSGDSIEWGNAEWQELSLVGKGGSDYLTQAKILYSDNGLYFLFKCDDMQLTCHKNRDFDDIYTDDVVEIFLWPSEKQNLYLEYELSPMDFELPLLVPNNKKQFFGWLPWHYEGNRRCLHKTTIIAGEKKEMAAVKGWFAEIFIPFELFKGFESSPPQKGSVWRANLYRMDYDNGSPLRWAWCTDTGVEFHDFEKFGSFIFD